MERPVPALREPLSFSRAVGLLAAGEPVQEMPADLQVALAIPLNAVVKEFRARPQGTRADLIEAACDPYVQEILAASRGDLATMLVAADALAVNFGVGRVVLEATDRRRLALLPNPQAPAAFRQLIECILRELPSHAGRAAPTLTPDPSYA